MFSIKVGIRHTGMIADFTFLSHSVLEEQCSLMNLPKRAGGNNIELSSKE